MATFVSITKLSPAPILQSKILSVVVLIGTSQEVPPSLKEVPNMSLHHGHGGHGAENTAFVSFQGTGFRIYDPIQELVSVDGEIWSQHKKNTSIFGCVSMGTEGSNQKHFRMNQSIDRSINQSINQINQLKCVGQQLLPFKKSSSDSLPGLHFLTTPHFLVAA